MTGRIAEEGQCALLACSRDDPRHDGFEAEARDRRQATRHQRGRGEANTETHPAGALDAERRSGAVEHVPHDVVGLLVRRSQDADAGGAMREHMPTDGREAHGRSAVYRGAHATRRHRTTGAAGTTGGTVQACLKV